MSQPGGEPQDAAALESLTYEQARAELDDVVRRLEASDLPLDDLMGLWERGEALAAVCEARLAGARQRLDAVRAAREQGEAD